jgi:hypothetical protein
MATPEPRVEADDALVDEIIRRVDGATDARRVRSLLTAWWRYAGVRAAAGAVVDSDRFLAERADLGLLELPPAVARAVIETEFALLHEGAPAAAAEPAAPAPQSPLAIVPPAAIPAPATPAAGAALEPAELQEQASLAAPLPLSAFERFRLERAVAGPDAAARAQNIVLAGLVVFFSLAIGLAIVAASVVGHIEVPLARAAALVSPWRAWLAIFTGAGGIAIARVLSRRSFRLADALRWPALGLGGLVVAGIGLLGGSVAAAGVGCAVLLGGAGAGAVHRSAR